ncbi:MAG TPA: T9SS type A sorting domain-containing protein, partial [Candidatus Kapabacteria bacterium]|nr:T9SS type A sorting domain-containing protein [Candidatus Kapabacteria bacterium]
TLISSSDSVTASYVFSPTAITLYAVTDSGTYPVAVDSTDSASVFLSVPAGKYIMFAQPSGSYLSGYYKLGAYAATWTDADTINVMSGGTNYLYMVLPPDTNIAMQGGGSQIDGVVDNASGNPLADTHLLLYQKLSAPAGGVNQRLLYTTMTDANGNYSFGRVPAGTYGILVDVVGKPAYEIGDILVSGADTTVKQNITYTITEVSGRVDISPSQVYLAQNYPNPFTGVTNILFSVPTTERVTLKIFNALGQEIATLTDGEVSAGMHNVLFSAEGLQNGMYWYRLSAGGQVRTGEMSIVR